MELPEMSWSDKGVMLWIPDHIDFAGRYFFEGMKPVRYLVTREGGFSLVNDYHIPNPNERFYEIKMVTPVRAVNRILDSVLPV